ncbi:capsid triplex subunit 1 [Macropodid alphaherpesvirus 1]|uniref:Capsid triplex subunit 1 n=1 Tax=Macropodid alphaherpesvirus 1 TaxID=137443 RepID=A0A0Y0A6L7_9ALPH|nr:capsid triplex subunit 1 [Macropodid alphaherpesvirus 1]AMB17027.1 capsid triplex subunit 1 [Macropodid alphaherpesvirus 1]
MKPKLERENLPPRIAMGGTEPTAYLRGPRNPTINRPHGSQTQGTHHVSASTLWLLGISPSTNTHLSHDQKDTAAEVVRKILYGVLPNTSTGANYRLTRQMTLTDFYQPDADKTGAIVLVLRNPGDFAALARMNAPPGRNVGLLGEAWAALLENSSLGGCRLENGCTRASLVSLNFLIAACADFYDKKDAADALRSHIIANYGGQRLGLRLDRFRECLQAMVHTHVFPHELLHALGGTISWVSQDELARVTLVCEGAQDASHTGDLRHPRSAVTVPACAFIDMDQELGYTGAGAAYIYLVFIYRQHRGQEQCRVHVIKSQLTKRAFQYTLEHMFGRFRTTNTLRGIEEIAAANDNRPGAFPFMELFDNPCTPRCSAGQVDLFRCSRRLYQWHPDTRGRPTARTCAYAAFAELGMILDDSPRYSSRVERYGQISVPMVILDGMVWRLGEWQLCA